MNLTVPASAFFLPEPKGQNSGVDFLGLRQTNLDMMADLIPGTNNVTGHIRPFSLLSWIFWKFHGLCRDAEIEDAKSDDMRAFRERIEVLFTWGARITNFPGIPGKQAEPPPADDSGLVSLTFRDWKRVQDSTSLIAALWYGPASKAVTGLNLLMPVPGRGGFFRAIGVGVALAEALDESLRSDGVRYERLLNTLDPVRANEEDAVALWEIWRPEATTTKEQKVFRSVLHDESAIGDYDSLMGRRSSTLALACLHLSETGEPQFPADIRRGMMLSQCPAGRVYHVSSELTQARNKWVMLQVRQLQRLALESLLSWSENKILGGVRDTADLVAGFAEEWDESDYLYSAADRLNDALSALEAEFSATEEFIACCREGALIAPLELIEKIQDAFAANDGWYAPHCLNALLICATFARCSDADTSGLRLGGPERIPLYHLRKRLLGLGDATIREAISYILEAMVISQHFATAVNRFDGQNQRLRLAIEEAGLVPLIGSPWRPTVTEDRLPMLLSLAADSNIIGRSTDGRYSSLA